MNFSELFSKTWDSALAAGNSLLAAKTAEKTAAAEAKTAAAQAKADDAIANKVTGTTPAWVIPVAVIGGVVLVVGLVIALVRRK